MHWPNNYAETDFHRTIGPPGSEMELIHTVSDVDDLYDIFDRRSNFFWQR